MLSQRNPFSLTKLSLAQTRNISTRKCQNSPLCGGEMGIDRAQLRSWFFSGGEGRRRPSARPSQLCWLREREAEAYIDRAEGAADAPARASCCFTHSLSADERALGRARRQDRTQRVFTRAPDSTSTHFSLIHCSFATFLIVKNTLSEFFLLL
jgi:hypothetical protein